VAETETDLRVSRQLIGAVKLGGIRAYVIARRAGLSESTLSRLINGVERIRPDDPRVLAVAEAVGVPAERAFARSRPR
jgi:transcriptional regulator with XRE-family HTH domain